MDVTRWSVVLTRTALEQLARIKDKRVQQAIRRRLAGLEHEPDKQGKALTDELARYRSIWAVGQRYRIIYRIEESRIVVHIVGVGLRKEGSQRDIYVVAQHLLGQGLLDEE